jgi:hypothetical protein
LVAEAIDQGIPAARQIRSNPRWLAVKEQRMRFDQLFHVIDG